ncbi:nucleotide triphosphate diphosphatase NUDT15 [Streptomyces liangshanensis]|uniref:nucleotide triphosphate diphosphatase NUDT15 n=1 Tax=Streptomyces liangshanensis TaxID=2717324 RepID=UPI0036DD6E52
MTDQEGTASDHAVTSVDTVGGPPGPVDPARLLPRLAAEIPPGGRLELTVRTGELTQELWEDLLVEAGFIVDEIVPVSVLDQGAPVLCRLIRARRRLALPRPRVTSRPRAAAPPRAHSTIGVGVIVRNRTGRILLGLHRGGTWELPGGKLEPGESVAAAAVRELREETGLAAQERDVTVFAMLHDTTAGLTRVTMAAVVTAYEGVPFAAEPESIAEWRWVGTDELPSPLFVPSAQILTTWRPELDVDHPPVHRLPLALAGERAGQGGGGGRGGEGCGVVPRPAHGLRARPA